jgi:uncharacterized protein DUF1996
MLRKPAAILLMALAILLATAPSSVGSSSRPPAMRMTTGVFDTGCAYSHTLPDDPLVHPNMPGMSHVHDFFGNRTTTGRSSGTALLNAARTNPEKTTCKDKLDDSGYWAPALYQDGVKVRPDRMHIYYRHRGSVPAKVFPVGFAMITHRHWWSCGPGSMKYFDGTVPACPNGHLFVVLTFPGCWDGVHLFTQIGSHVSFAMRSRCDAAHPVRIPTTTIFLSYRVDGKPHKYVLASGNPSTAHADFLNAWEPKHLAHLVDACLNKGRVAGCKNDENR